MRKRGRNVNCEVNSYFDEVSWNLLVSNGKQKSYKRGEKILVRGQPSPGLICLKAGKVKISSDVSNGSEKIFGLLIAPNIFGETEAFDRGPCMISATAQSHVDIAIVSSAEMSHLIGETPELAYFIIRSLGVKLRWTTFQAEDMTSQRIGYRLANLLLGQDKYAVFPVGKDPGVLNITHEEIAHFIGSTRPKVTLLLREFADKGFIDSKRGEIRILNTRALRGYIESLLRG
jgi:CRP/FNR family transcriptional regulator, cyclic AMP receptor protein